MKILFDISVLGNGHSVSHTRTGVFRVVEHLALGLHGADNCQTTFCASGGNYSVCRSYLDSLDGLQGYILSQPADLLSRVYNFAEPIRLEIAKLPPKSWKIPFRKTYHYGRKYLHTIESKDIHSADIYHSPSAAIPEQLQLEKRITKFITIHDLIPLVCPQYCTPAGTVHMKAILGSITPDTFVSCDSEATRQDFLTCLPFFDPARVSVVYLAAGEHFYRCTDEQRLQLVRHKYGIPDGSRYFLALSTLQPRKNFERIIQAFITLVRQEHLHDLCLVLVGADGWDYERIYEEIEKAGEYAGRIILSGYAPDEDLAPLYSDALAFLYPSLYEGFGLPPLEAMQCGTPVITSNNSSLPEVVGAAAIMIDPEDDDALCQAMLDLCTNDRLREELSVMSIARAKLFDWEKTTRDMIRVYEKALLS